MGDYKRSFGGGRGGSGSFGGGGRGGNRFGDGGRGGRDSRGGVVMHKTVCSKCNSPCEVPFLPRGDKPVYCSDCYEKPENPKRISGRDYTRSDSDDTSRRFRRDDDRSYSRDYERSKGRDFDRPNYKEKRMFATICDECGQRCEVPFKPTAGKPVYCDSCFGKKGPNSGSVGTKSPDQNKNQFEMINIKLDKILKFLAPFMEDNTLKMDTKTKSKDSNKKIAAKKEDIVEKKKEALIVEKELEPAFKKDSKPVKSTKKAVAKKSATKSTSKKKKKD